MIAGESETVSWMRGNRLAGSNSENIVTHKTCERGSGDTHQTVQFCEGTWDWVWAVLKRTGDFDCICVLLV